MVRILMAVACLLSSFGAAGAADIRVLSTPTLKTVLDDIGPAFERESGHKLVLRFDGVPNLKRDIEAGTAFDVAILVPTVGDELARQGKIAAGTHVPIARTVTGIAVRTGHSLPPLTTPDDVRRTLLSVGRLAYSADSASGTAFLAMLQQLGIEPQVHTKLVKVTGRSPVSAVATNEADATVITVPNIVGVQGVALGGLLPEALQTPTAFSAGLSLTGAGGPGAALIGYLRSARAAEALRMRGFEPTL